MDTLKPHSNGHNLIKLYSNTVIGTLAIGRQGGLECTNIILFDVHDTISTYVH